MESIIRELREKAEVALTAANDMVEQADTEKRTLTTDEQARFDGLVAENETLQADAARRERLVAAKAAIAASQRKTTPAKVQNSVIPTVEIPRLCTTNLRAFKGQDALERAYAGGKWLMGSLFNHAASRQWCMEHGMEFRTQNESVNTAGGFLVPTQIEQTIIDLRETYGVGYRFGKIVPMSSDNMTIPRRTGGVVMYAVGEEEEIKDSSKSWDQVQLSTKKWGALVRYSSELNEDAIINLADDLTSEIAYADASKMDTCLFDGTGTTATFNGIRGIRPILIDGSHAGGYYTDPGAGNSVDKMSNVTDAALTNMMALLPAYAMARSPKWYCPVPFVHAAFTRLMRAAGGVTVGEMMGSGTPVNYAGYPIVPVAAWTDTPSTDNTGKIMVLFGCLDLCTTIGVRRGMTIRVDESRYSEYDQIGIRGTTRWDINNHDLGSASVTGPMVGLLGN